MTAGITLLLFTILNGHTAARPADANRQLTVAAAADVTFVFKDVAALPKARTGATS